MSHLARRRLWHIPHLYLPLAYLMKWEFHVCQVAADHHFAMLMMSIEPDQDHWVSLKDPVPMEQLCH